METVWAFLGFILVISTIAVFYTRARKAEQAIDLLVELYDVLNDVMVATPADRITIWRVSNSGGQLHHGTPFYLNVLHEDFLPPNLPVKTRYVDVPVDGDFFRLLKKVKDDGEVYVSTEGLPSSWLFRSFHALGIKHARFYDMPKNRKYIFLLCLSTMADDPMNSAKDIDTFTAGVAKISRIFNNLPK